MDPDFQEVFEDEDEQFFYFLEPLIKHSDWCLHQLLFLDCLMKQSSFPEHQPTLLIFLPKIRLLYYRSLLGIPAPVLPKMKPAYGKKITDHILLSLYGVDEDYSLSPPITTDTLTSSTDKLSLNQSSSNATMNTKLQIGLSVRG
ncbi:hypothetical protein NQ318_022038 [Aromia moschata]|uniref:Maturase K n=1 Tax=Aromia moschata TaxID=1265417 RepID=A0AAV8Z7A4_9CUCU|nr:hypothetical protein NQ318_022038 [Aromia moschata]